MSCGVLTRLPYLNCMSLRRIGSTRVKKLEKRVVINGEQSSWKDLANLSYGKETINHQHKLRKTFSDLQRVLESDSDMQLMEIGSYAVGASTPASDLDVLIVPYAYDGDDGRINEFKRKMEEPKFKKDKLFALARKLSHAGILKKKPEVFHQARVPIITGITRSGVCFDIQMGEIECIYSSNFVRFAFQLDPRQICVYHWLRQQVEKYRIFGGKINLFTAFHLYMLIIHFAQATKILPNLMDEYPEHLSRACHWSDLTAEFRVGKNVLPPLYTTEDVDRWAPVLIEQLIEYYSKIDFTMTEINVEKGSTRNRVTNNLLLIEPFHDRQLGVCKVANGAKLMNVLFAKLLKNRSG